MDPLRVPAPQETKLHFLDYWRIIRIRKTVILAVFLLVVITATLVTFILPESYSSTARIKVERDQSDISFNDPMRGYGNAYDPFFIQTEFETILSERVLGKVVADLHLDTEWGKKYNNGVRLSENDTISMLKNNVSLQPVRNTSFLEIRVFRENAEEAKTLANAIAQAYKDYRLEQRKELSMGGIAALEARFKEHEVKVHDAQVNVDHLREVLGISDAVAAEAGPSMLMSADSLRKLEALRIETDAQFMREETLVAGLTNLPHGQLIQALPTAAPDTLLSSLLEQQSLAEQKLVLVQKEYGPEHPEVIKAVGQIEDLKKKIDNRVDGIVIGLTERIASLKVGLEKLKTEVENAKQEDIQTAAKSRPYFEAKRKLEELQRFGQLLEMKIASERIELSLPKTMMVEIMDFATAGVRPVRPNKPLNIALGIIIGLVVGVGLAFFIEYLDTSVKTIDDVERSL